MCPHHPDGVVAGYRQDCACRKPKPAMITDLLHDWPVDAPNSLLIGDKETDISAGRQAGLTSAMFSGGNLLEFVRAQEALPD
jgi:D-glycero-D-manno-heptose 1,7-bisphosphate phosphatase